MTDNLNTKYIGTIEMRHILLKETKFNFPDWEIDTTPALSLYQGAIRRRIASSGTYQVNKETHHCF
ncbi:hypothetical protein [Parabacteroides sp.]